MHVVIMRVEGRASRPCELGASPVKAVAWEQRRYLRFLGLGKGVGSVKGAMKKGPAQEGEFSATQHGGDERKET